MSELVWVVVSVKRALFSFQCAILKSRSKRWLRPMLPPALTPSRSQLMDHVMLSVFRPPRSPAEMRWTPGRR